MCGLVGAASVAPLGNRTWLSAACEAIGHRGPDDTGTWWSEDGRVGMGHRRLSIIDLSQAGHQPMHLDGHDLSIIFNGEIYNFQEVRHTLEGLGYRFKSHSDTEVLLAAYDAWGADCLAHLNGMFAFALLDRPRQKLFLARDRAGEKPLFYRHEAGTLFFASELKALLANPALPRRIDATSLDCYLAMGYVPGDRCILEGYHKLPPAHAMFFDLQSGRLDVWRYWQLPPLDDAAAAGVVDEEALLHELEALLEDAVSRQMVADVPVGVLLSGGVDSSLITAMAVRRSRKVRTFCIGFPGHGAADETEHARLIAKHFGTEHTELAAQPGTADLLPRLAQQFDEPLVDSSMIPTWLVSNLVRQHCTVALGGDGGDELFGGYGHYNRLLWMESRLGEVPLPVRRAASYGATKVLPVGFKGRNWLQAVGTDMRRGLPLVANYFDARARRDLLGDRAPANPTAEQVFAERIPRGGDLLQRATRMDFNNYMAEDILVKVDRASMSNSLEVRAPFLDYRVIEFAFGRVPSHLKTTSTSRKILLKRLCERLLPPEFDKQRKQGFGVPIVAWLKEGPFRDLFWSVLSDDRTIFDKDAVASLLKGQDKGFGNGERLFALVQFELWRRAYNVSL
jgi:asparagine synthase (glutamine-hydrolysing)